jgi:hypothetical protein
LEALRQLATIFDAAIPRSATVFFGPVPSNATNKTTSPAFHPPYYSAPVHPATPIAVHGALFPTHAPPPMGPRHAPSPRVSPRLAPFPRVGPSRTPAPRVRASQAPSQRVSPRQAPSQRVIPSQAPPAVPPTPNHLRHQPLSPRAHVPQPHRSSPNGHGSTGTNLYGEFEGAVEEEDVPSQHRTHSQTSRHSAHAVHAMPMANAVIHPPTGTNIGYRGLISDDDTFPTWDRAAANDFGRLAQGVGGRIEGSNKIFFIPRSAVPRNKTVTYGRFVVDVRPNKE